MSSHWSIYVIALVVLNLVGCLWLIWWTGKRRADDPKPDDTSHYWDGDITEYNQPMPRWWINLFYLTIAFAVGYLIYYPGLGAFQGTSKSTSQREHASETARVQRAREAFYKIYDQQSVEQLSSNSVALEQGRAVFLGTCAACHGSSAKGSKGFPDLSDGIWHWGGSADEILASVQQGRIAAMPPWEAAVGGAEGVNALVAYVRTLGSGAPVGADASIAAAQTQYQTLCIACHGPEGKGNVALGAPDLTDSYWLYGDSDAAIAESIAKGRNGAMPAHLELLGETRSKLAAAYVYSLRNAGNTAAAGTAP